jgi:hypothetical protein
MASFTHYASTFVWMGIRSKCTIALYEAYCTKDWVSRLRYGKSLDLGVFPGGVF